MWITHEKIFTPINKSAQDNKLFPTMLLFASMGWFQFFWDVFLVPRILLLTLLQQLVPQQHLHPKVSRYYSPSLDTFLLLSFSCSFMLSIFWLVERQSQWWNVPFLLIYNHNIRSVMLYFLICVSRKIP